jgi:hypothetical protein
MMVVTNKTVAENAVCSWEGRKILKNRRETDKGLEFAASGGPGIKRDFTRKYGDCLVSGTAHAATLF